MKQPTNRQLLAWWDEQPDGEYTCHDCGTTGSSHYVQPQHPFYAEGREDVARCADCINARNRESARKHKQVLNAMPRCEVDGCTRRGTWRIMGVLLCGWCKRRLKKSHAKAMSGTGGLGIFVTPNYSREDILRMAQS